MLVIILIQSNGGASSIFRGISRPEGTATVPREATVKPRDEAVCQEEVMHTEAQVPAFTICLTQDIKHKTKWSRKVHIIPTCDWALTGQCAF